MMRRDYRILLVLTTACLCLMLLNSLNNHKTLEAKFGQPSTVFASGGSCLMAGLKGHAQSCGPPFPCFWPCTTPIILDLSGQGFFLTDAKDGVLFDISGTGSPIQMGWTASGADNGFLALDRNGDGVINDGTELFGSFTPQPPSDNPNGFRALAVFDEPQNGGNGDGVIDSRDKIYSSLVVWIDVNHDGVCQRNELHSLSSLGVDSISLSYHSSERRDQYGNLFRYRAKVNPGSPADTSEVGKTAYDVNLVTSAFK